MALYHSIIIFSVVLVAVFARGGDFGRHGHGGRGGGPSFLRNLTKDQRQAFFDIVKNEDLTKAEIQTQLDEWAANISDDFAQTFQDITAQWQQKKQEFQQRVEQKLANDTAALQVLKEIEAVQNDQSITRAQERDQIRSILNSTTQQIRRKLHSFAKGGRRGRGRRGGGREGGSGRGRKGGFGGNQSGSDHRGGFGGQQGGSGGPGGSDDQQSGFGGPGESGGQRGGFSGSDGSGEFGGNQGYGNSNGPTGSDDNEF